MRLIPNKARRRLAQALLSLAPRRYRRAVDQWLRGRQEFNKLRAADYVVVSYGKSGRTWLRTMISRCYQAKFGLPEGSVIGFDNFHKACADIPKVFFTHDHYLKYYTGHTDSKRDYYDKKVILLVRDPRDVAVSNFFQRKYRASELTRKVYAMDEDEASMYEFVTGFSMPRSIGFLNAWGKELGALREVLLIRYEDMRKDPESHLARVMEFMGLETNPEQVQDVVAYARFENMKKREKTGAETTQKRRLFGGDGANPDSYKVRRGKIGGYTDYFSEQESEQINAIIHGSLMEFYRYS